MTIPSPQTRPDLPWRRLGATPVVYAYEPARGGRVWVLCFQEQTGANFQHLCQNPPQAGRWVTMFAQQQTAPARGATGGPPLTYG